MRKARFNDEQIDAILQEAERTDRTSETVRPHGISRETLYRWRRKYGGFQVSEARRLRALEEENRRLKRVVADQALNIQVLKACWEKSGDETLSLRSDQVGRWRRLILMVA